MSIAESEKSFLSKSVYDAKVEQRLNIFEGGDEGAFCNTAFNQCISVSGQALKITGNFDGSVILIKVSYFHRFVACDNMLSPLQCILSWDFIEANRLQQLVWWMGGEVQC